MIRCMWTPPSRYANGNAIRQDSLSGFTLKMRAEGAPYFTTVATLAPTEGTFDVDVNDPGTYQFQLTAQSSNGQSSAAAEGSITVPSQGEAVETPLDDGPLEAPVLQVVILS